MTELKYDGEKTYLISTGILPKAIYKTVLAKEMLAKGECQTINEAVQAVGISRSVFYKYRNGIFPFYQGEEGQELTVSFVLEHREGVLSAVLGQLSVQSANIITINQSTPAAGVAHVIISLRIGDTGVSREDILAELSQISGVMKLQVVRKGRSDNE